MSTVKTDSKGQIQKPTNGAALAAAPVKQEVQTLDKVLASPAMKAEIARALPRHVTPDRMARIIMTALRTTPKLIDCTPESFFGCVLQAAQLGLEPNTPLQHCFLIPRWNTKKRATECTFLMGYPGMIELSMRSGRMHGISAQGVREGDIFDYEYGLTPHLRHKPSGDADREERPITHVYAIGRMKDGEPSFEVLTKAQIEARRFRSSFPDGGPWASDYEAMAKKSSVRALWKWLPKSPEMARADALEHAADVAATQSNALDPAVTEALGRTGLQPIDVESEPTPESATSAAATVGDDLPPALGGAREPGSEG